LKEEKSNFKRKFWHRIWSVSKNEGKKEKKNLQKRGDPPVQQNIENWHTKLCKGGVRQLRGSRRVRRRESAEKKMKKGEKRENRNEAIAETTEGGE